MKTIIYTLLFTIALSTQAQKIVGYLPYYRGVNANFDYTKYTHLHYFAIWPAADGSFIYPGAEDSLSMATDFADLTNKVAGSETKLIITFGGTAENGSEHFAEMAKDDVARLKFINNVIQLSTSWNADGIDIDWEWGSPNSPQDDRDANGVLLTELRTACDNAQLTLSVDVSPSSYNGNNYDATKIGLADYINVMSYSYNGGWASTTGHHTGLDQIKTSGVNYWTGRGLPKSKLNIGSAFYAFKYNGTYQPGTAFTGIETLTYTQVKNLISDGYEVVENNASGTYCYSVSDNAIVYYDSPLNVEAKMQHAINDNLSGVIIWEIGQDDSDQSLSTALSNNQVTVKEAVNNDFVFEFYLENGVLRIKSDIQKYSLSVYNLAGQLLINSTINSNTHVINLSHLSQQLVLLKFQNQGEVYTQKLLLK